MPVTAQEEETMFDFHTIDFKKIEAILKEAACLFRNDDSAAHVTEKGRADFVTEVDMTVQRVICDRLRALYPEIQFMGEEKDNRGIDFDRPVWILDPVDGTTNLIFHFQASCISLGLAYRREVVAGMIYNPYFDELFFATKGGGAFRNGQPIHVHDAATLADSLVAVGTTPYSREYTDSVFRQIKNVFQRSLDIRRTGSAAIDLAYVACGRTDAFFEQFLKPWDFSAGLLLVQEAGGTVTDYAGNPITPTKPQAILATNGRVHAEMIEALRGFV